MLTAKQFAQAIKRPYPTVMGWLQAKIIPGAQVVESPIGNYYEIPADILNTFEPPKIGRPRKAKAEESATTKKIRLTKKPAKK